MLGELTLDDATATDNCGEVTIEVTAKRLPATAMAATLTRTFGHDDAGNSTSATQPSRLRTTPSSRAFLPTTRLSVDAMPMDDASASDNCSDVSITVSETLAGNAANNYTLCVRLRRTLVATALTTNDTVEDTTAPELSIPADYTAECSTS